LRDTIIIGLLHRLFRSLGEKARQSVCAHYTPIQT
jgi:hypothetical protein